MRSRAGTATFRRCTAPLLALAALLLLAAPAAAAEPERIGGPSEYPATLGPGGLERLKGVAVSAAEGGAIYVTDASVNQRVSEFSKEGAFFRAFGWGVVPGAAAGSGDLTNGSTQVANAATASGRFLVGDILTGPGIRPATEIVAVGSASLELSKPATESKSGVALTVAAGPGNVPVNELQTLTIGGSPTGGSFTLTFTSPNPGSTTQTTTAIPYNATATGAGSVQEALESLSNLGAGSVSLSGPAGGPWTVEFSGRYADVNVSTLHANASALTPSGSVAVSTPRQGAGVLETCATVCAGESTEEGQEFGQGSAPGQLRYADAVAIDNDPSSSSYGDLYVVDQRNFRVERFSSTGEFQLMFGGEVDRGPHHPGNLCTAAYLAEGDACGAGVPGTGPARFYRSGSLSWSNDSSNSIAVGPAGTVYVGDFGRVQEFNPEGEFTGEFKLPDSEPTFVSSLATDSAGDLYERSVNYNGNDEIALQAPGVREYGPAPAHSFIQTFDAEEAASKPIHIATDPAGDLFVSDPNGLLFSGCGAHENGCPEMTFRAFKPAGQLYAIFTSPQVVTRQDGFEPTGLAFGNGRLYAATELNTFSSYAAYVAPIAPPVSGPPQVLTGSQRSEGIEPETATLRAVVNPEGYPTKVHFEYTDQAEFEAHGFSECGEAANPNCHKTAETELPLTIQNDPVSTALSGLRPGTAYRWRAVAANECNGSVPPNTKCESKGEGVPGGEGTDATFTTLPPVGIRNFTTQTVAPEEVELKAEISPNNGSATNWKICLGTEAGNYGKCVEGTLHVLGNEFEAITASFEHLTPNTEYHYRLEATNSYGVPVKSADQALTTELSSAEERAAEDCPLNGTVHGAEGGSTLREENHSTALPDCRAYEQVSPPNKEGYGVEHQVGLAPSGGRVAFDALGAFAGASALGSEPDQYLAHRTSEGWLTQPSLAYAAGPGWQLNGLVEYDPGLENWLFRLAPGFAAEAIEPTSSAAFYLGRADGSFDPAGPTIAIQSGAAESGKDWPDVVAQSADLSRFFVLSSKQLLPEDPLPDAQGNQTTNRIYEVEGGGPSPSLRLVAAVPADLAATHGETETCRLDTEFSLPLNSSSADGQTLFYNGPLDLAPGKGCQTDHGLIGGAPNKSAVFACSLATGPCVPGLPGYHQPTQLSTNATPQCAETSPCRTSPVANAHLLAISPDGRLAWFTTDQALVDSDSDETGDLYLARLSPTGQLESLIQASRGESGAGLAQGNGAEVQGVLAVSPDATRAYFVARGLLTAEANPTTHHAPLAGADNLYAYDATSGQTKFVARLCSGSEQSGAVPDPACDRSLDSHHDDSQLWAEADKTPPREAQTTPDGRFLLFDSYGRLTPDDTDAGRSVFRYDIETGRLGRVSLGRRGNDANANDPAYEATIPGAHESVVYGGAGPSLDRIAEDAGRAISADGSIVIFRTAAPLVSRDTDALHATRPGCGASVTGPHGEQLPTEGCDVYEWEQAGHGTCPPAEAAGCISLISPGTDPHNVREAVISSSGEDVTFLTVQGIFNGDIDGVTDVYDARVNGGFPYVPKHKICNGAETPEGCNRHATEERLQINPASEVNEHGPEPVNKPKRCRKGFVLRHGRCVRKHHRHRRRHHRAARVNKGGAK